MVYNEEWRSIADAAALIGVEERSLRRYVQGLDGRPLLESREVRGAKCVQASAAYDHLKAHGKGLFKGLKAPPGYSVDSERKETDDKFDADIVKALAGVDPSDVDPHELAWKLLCAGVAPEKIRSSVAVANSIQRKRDAAVRAGKNVPPDDVVRMLRAYGDLFVDEVDQGSTRFANELMKFLREKLNVDPLAKNKDAAMMIEQLHREVFGNSTITAIRKRVDDQVRGIRMMEFSQ